VTTAVDSAVLIDVFSGEIRQGGSTITQQLVKQLYTKGEKTIHRKIIEILIAPEFEKKFTKWQSSLKKQKKLKHHYLIYHNLVKFHHRRWI